MNNAEDSEVSRRAKSQRMKRPEMDHDVIINQLWSLVTVDDEVKSEREAHTNNSCRSSYRSSSIEWKMISASID